MATGSDCTSARWIVGGAGDDPLGHAKQQRERAGDDATRAIDVLKGVIDSALPLMVHTVSAHSSSLPATRVS
jgi:hypothetical protein